MRPGTDTIAAPPFPAGLQWVNVASLRMDKLRGDPVLIEFWDFCRPNSLRALPYIRAWHDRYAELGLRVISVHCAGFEPSSRPDAVRDAVARLGIEHPVAIDAEFELWREYENAGWPARYLWDRDSRLAHFHFGEGAYEETELEIQRLLGTEREPLEPLRPEDAPGATVLPQSPDQPGLWSGDYEAGAVWGIFDGTGTVDVNGTPLAVPGPGAYELIGHERHTRGRLELRLGAGVRCHGVCFTPGVAG